jgi:hypothetical protein
MQIPVSFESAAGAAVTDAKAFLSDEPRYGRPGEERLGVRKGPPAAAVSMCLWGRPQALRHRGLTTCLWWDMLTIGGDMGTER